MFRSQVVRVAAGSKGVQAVHLSPWAAAAAASTTHLLRLSAACADSLMSGPSKQSLERSVLQVLTCPSHSFPTGHVCEMFAPLLVIVLVIIFLVPVDEG